MKVRRASATGTLVPLFLSLTFSSAALASPGATLCDSPALPFQAETRIKGTIGKVSDGDTIHFLVKSDGSIPPTPSLCPSNTHGPIQSPSPGELAGVTRLKVRMTGIDTPELHLPVSGGIASQGYWAEQAHARLEALLPIGSDAELVDYGKDHYGRTLGRVYSNSKDVHLILLEEGLAALYLICTGEACDSNFIRKQKVAIYSRACKVGFEEKRGIYSEVGGLPELPFEFRLRKQNRVADKWVGDLRTKKLYAPTDYNQVPVCDRLFFPIKDEAIALGFTPVN